MLDLYVNIKNRRKELGMTQTELANKTGYSNKSSIATIEAGKVDLPLSKINEFAVALNCSAEYLMGWDTGIYEDDKKMTKEALSKLSHQIHDVPVDKHKLFNAIQDKNIAIDELADMANVSLATIEGLIFTNNNLATEKEVQSLQKILGPIIDDAENARLRDKYYNLMLNDVLSERPNALSDEETMIVTNYRSADDLTKAMVRRTLGMD